MLLFSRLDPADVDPHDFVDRESEIGQIVAWLSNYLDLRDAPRGRAFCVTGEKGIGKSILTRAALDKVKRSRSAGTVFLTVDCRGCGGLREVIRAVASAAIEELTSLQKATAPVPQGLIDAAGVVDTLARFDVAEARTVHETLARFKAAVDLGGEQALLSVLKASFGIAIERSETEIQSLVGAVKIDDRNLVRALLALVRDIREQGFGVVLYLDNVDEIEHRAYRHDDARARVRTDTETLVGLAAAPLALVLNMRTYFSSVLPREVPDRVRLSVLPAATLEAILDRRLAREPQHVRDALARPACRRVIADTARAAPTPLAFLGLFRFLCQQGLQEAPDALAAVAQPFLDTYYATVPADVLQRVVAAFDDVATPMGHAALLSACGGNEALVNQILDWQVVLPRDYWNPTEFTLDPELHFLHPGRRAV